MKIQTPELQEWLDNRYVVGRVDPTTEPQLLLGVPYNVTRREFRMLHARLCVEWGATQAVNYELVPAGFSAEYRTPARLPTTIIVAVRVVYNRRTKMWRMQMMAAARRDQVVVARTQWRSSMSRLVQDLIER